MHTAIQILDPTMSASKALAASPQSGIVPRAFLPRRRRLRRSSIAVTAAPRSSVSTVSVLLVAGIALMLALLACSLIVTGLAVWVANGAAEWLAAAVPAVLAGLLIAFAWRMARLLQPPAR